jgi:hypothetical protein
MLFVSVVLLRVVVFQCDVKLSQPPVIVGMVRSFDPLLSYCAIRGVSFGVGSQSFHSFFFEQ